MTEIDFYILPQAQPGARLSFVARLAEKIFQTRRHLLIASASSDQAEAMSRSLWHTRPDSFIGHSIVAGGEQSRDPVLICHEPPPAYCHDVLINLSDTILEDHFSRFHRLVEVVSQEPDVLTQTRAAYQFYKSRGYPIRSHKIKESALMSR